MIAATCILIAVTAIIAAALLRRRLHAAHREIATLRSGIPARLDVERQRAAVAERQRLFANLHDDIGAKLLTLIHSLHDPAHADLARAVMQDLRDIVSRSQLGPCTLLEALAQIREETEQRLDIVGSTLDWQQGQLPDPELDEASALHLFRISREAVTNALRHGHATRIRVRMQAADGILLLDVTDDGPGLAPDRALAGRGTSSMRARANELQGSIAWTPGTQGGTKVVLQFPLPTHRTSPSAATRSDRAGD